MMHALVNGGTVDRIATDIDPTVGTKAGWRWLPVIDTPQPALGPGQSVEPTQAVEAERVVRGWTVVELPLAELRAMLSRRIDSDAERCRLRYITPGAGQAMTYREKLEQAEQIIAAGQSAADALSADEARAAYPTLAASIGIEAPSLWGCAQLVWAKYQQWCALSHLIEKTRLTAKQAIANATANDAVRAVYAGVKWP
jgi:hypothetical protein